MTTHKGNEGTVKIGSDALGELRSFSVTERAATIDDSAIGDAADTHLIGSTNWEGQATAAWDPSDTAQGGLVAGATVTLNMYPMGAGSGAYYLTGTATVTQVGVTSSRNALIEQSFSFTGNGALSRTSVGS